MEIQNRSILITGANRGIGRAFALAVARDKTELHVVVRKEDPGLEKELLSAGAVSVRQWIADLSDRKQVEKFIQDTADLKVDILFNNAGLLTGGLLETQNIQEIYDMIQVNVSSLIHLTYAFLPRMLERKKGKIINHASIAALMHFPCSSTYAATKAAVWAFTDALRLELRNTGVTTLCLISPGVSTSMFDKLVEKNATNLKVPDLKVPVHTYADMIREAILFDLKTLEPKGITGLGLKINKYMPRVFDYAVFSRYRR